MIHHRTVTFLLPAAGQSRDGVEKISDFITAKGIEGLEWIRVPYPIDIAYEEPPAARLLADLGPGDNLLLSRVLQLGRSKSECLKWLKVALQKQINVYMVAAYWPSDLSMSSDFFVKILAAVVDAEREMGRERTKEGLAARRRAGVRLGRPKGSHNSKLDRYCFEIEALLATGVTHRYIAQRYSITVSQLRCWARQRGLNQRLGSS